MGDFGVGGDERLERERPDRTAVVGPRNLAPFLMTPPLFGGVFRTNSLSHSVRAICTVTTLIGRVHLRL